MQLPVSLVYLKWTNGSFHICPLDFTRLEKLVVLDLSHCRAMKMFSTSLANAKKLEWLELEGCRSLTHSALGEFKLHHFRHFGVNRTSLTKLPLSLGKSKDLTSLQTKETSLTRIPQWVGGLTLLASLILEKARVTRLPEAIGNLKFLKTLNLQSTSIGSLPESVGDILGLEQLDLAFTLLESFPLPILKLRSLKYLSVHGTQISTVPDAIGVLVELERLEISYTSSRIVPKTIGKLLRLKELYADISCEGSLQHLASLKSLQILQLEVGGESPLPLRDEYSQAEISSLLSPLSSLPELCTLYLAGRYCPPSLLSRFLCSLQQIPSLPELSLIRFPLVETMPCELGTLNGLQKLATWGWARLQELPEFLGNLCMLSRLELYDLPRLSGLPESLGALPALSLLVILDCESLQSMPRSMGHVSPLEQESFSWECSGRPPSESPRLPSPRQLQSMKLQTDSWTLLECSLECCKGHAFSQRAEYMVSCKDMERIMEVREEKQGGGYVVDIKVTAELFREKKDNFHGREIGHGPSTSHPHWHHCTELQDVDIGCSVYSYQFYWEKRDVHTDLINVMDIDEGSDESIEDIDSETNEDNESVEGIDSETNEDDQQDEDLGILENLPGSSPLATSLRLTLDCPTEASPTPSKSESNVPHNTRIDWPLQVTPPDNLGELHYLEQSKIDDTRPMKKRRIRK